MPLLFQCCSTCCWTTLGRSWSPRHAAFRLIVFFKMFFLFFFNFYVSVFVLAKVMFNPAHAVQCFYFHVSFKNHTLNVHQLAQQPQQELKPLFALIRGDGRRDRSRDRPVCAACTNVPIFIVAFHSFFHYMASPTHNLTRLLSLIHLISTASKQFGLNAHNEALTSFIVYIHNGIAITLLHMSSLVKLILRLLLAVLPLT